MIAISELVELIKTGAIETYKGGVEVIVDRRQGLVVIGQGERILVLELEQVEPLIRMLLYKVGG